MADNKIRSALDRRKALTVVAGALGAGTAVASSATLAAVAKGAEFPRPSVRVAHVGTPAARHVDNELIAAAALVPSYDAALQDLHERYEDDADSRPDYLETSDNRVDALERLATVPSRSEQGVRAKARVIAYLPDTDYQAILDIAASLAADILNLQGGGDVA